MLCIEVKGLQLRSHLKMLMVFLGYFCSRTVFNPSRKVLTETEIRVLEKGLGFATTPTRINKSDLKRDFNEFSRKMRCKWYFRNEPTENFSENQPLMLNLTGIHLTVAMH